MKYLRLFESKGISDKTKEALSDFNITEKEYLNMIFEIAKRGYSLVMSKLPFFLDMVSDDDYNLISRYGSDYMVDQTANAHIINTISHDQLRKIIDFYTEMENEKEKIEKIEDYFLDLIEDPKIDFKFKVDLGTSVINNIAFVFSYKSLSDISKMIMNIESRLKRSGCTYKFQNITNSNPTKETQLLSIRVSID